MPNKYLELKCVYCNRQNTDVKFDDEDDYPTFACEFCGEENEIVQGFYTRTT